MADPELVSWFSANEVIDAGHRLDWDDHDIAMLLATLEEMTEEA